MTCRILALFLAALMILTACSAPAAPAPQSPEPPPSSSAPEPLPEPPQEPEPEPEVDNSWTFDAPENHGMDPEVLADLHAALPNSAISSMVIVKDGAIVDEYYADGYDENSTFAIHSCSKSFTSALVGIAIHQGYLNGVEDLLSDYLPQVAELPGTKKDLTIRHLLTQTSGLEWYEWGSGYHNWEEFRSAPNWVEYILGRNQAAQPGQLFNYSTGNTHLLAAALEAATGKPLLEYGKETLFDALGMETISWGTDPQGVADGGNGVVISARDAARFGQLYLQGGVWKGRQLVPAEWVAQSTSVQNPGPGGSTGQYGYQWWIRPYAVNAFGTYRAPHGAKQYDAYHAFGAWGQYIFVVPELELVTVITCVKPQDSYAPRPFFTDFVLAACIPEEAAGEGGTAQ